MSTQTDCMITIIDDDDALRDALAVLVTAAGWRAVGYANAEEFLASLTGEPAGCALIDIKLPGMDGMELLHRLAEVAPGFPSVILTGHGDVPMAVEALKAGAVDFIEKPFDPDRLLSSLKQALSRDAVLRETKLAIEEFHSLIVKLTPREREVMDFMVLGESNKTIASTLGISPRTVEVYRARVMDKMQVQSLAELVRLTMRAQDRDAG